MKMKNLVKSITVALVALAAPIAAIAADLSGHIRSIESVNYTSGTRLKVGDKVWILVRMFVSNYEDVFANISEPKPWYFYNVSLSPSEVGNSLYRPKLGLSVGGRIAYAEYVDSISYNGKTFESGINSEFKYYQDFYFEYTVRPGDLGLPIKLLNSDNKVADDTSTDNYDYCLLNVDTLGHQVGAFWRLANADNDLAGFHFNGAAGGFEYPTKPNNDGEHVDITLVGANICVQTIDFDEARSASDATVWRDVYPGLTDNVATAPRIVGEGGTDGVTVWVWSSDQNVFVPHSDNPEDIKVIDGKTCLKVVIQPGASDATFKLKGGSAAENSTADIFLSSQALGSYDAVGDFMADSVVTQKVRVVKAPEPFLSVTDSVGNPNNSIPIEATTNYWQVTEMKVRMSVPYSDPSVSVKIALNPKIKDMTDSPLANNLIRIFKSIDDVGEDEPGVSEIEIPAGAQEAIFYVAGLGTYPGQKTTTIEMTPSIAAGSNPLIEDFFSRGFHKSSTLKVTDQAPVPTVTTADPITGFAQDTINIDVMVEDNWRDLYSNTNGYTVQVKLGSSSLTTNGVVFTDGNTIAFPITIPTEGALSGTVKVVDPAGRSGTATFNVDAQAALTVRPQLFLSNASDAEIDTRSEFYEGDAPFLRFVLSSVAQQKMYANLIPLDEMSSNLVSKAFLETDFFIEQGETKSAGGAIRFLDGDAFTSHLTKVNFSVVLKNESGDILTTHTPRTLSLTIVNANPTIAAVRKGIWSAGDSITNGATYGSIVPSGTPVMFTAKIFDPGDIDMTNGKSRVRWVYTDGPEGNNYTGMITTNVLTTGFATASITFNEADSVQTVTLYVQDGDQQTANEIDPDDFGMPVYSFKVRIGETPRVIIEYPQNNIGGDYYENANNNKDNYIIVKLSEFPLSTDHAAGSPAISASNPIKVKLTLDESYKSDYGKIELLKDEVVFPSAAIANAGVKVSFNMTSQNGGNDSPTMYMVKGEVINPAEHQNQYGTAWSDHYASVEKELYMHNVAPVINKPESATAGVAFNVTNKWTAGEEITLTLKASDTRADVSSGRFSFYWDGVLDKNGNSMVTIPAGTVGTGTVLKDTISTTFTFIVPDSPETVVTVTADDGDGGAQSYMFYIQVVPTKKIDINVVGPAESSRSKYANAAGIGRGHVHTKDGTGKYSATSFKHTWLFSETAMQAPVYAAGYPASETDAFDDGTLAADAGLKGIPLSPVGQNTSAAPYYNYKWDYDSFFYCWIEIGGEDGGSTIVYNAPSPTKKPATLVNRLFMLAAEKSEVGSYTTVEAEAIFSREMMESDNMGDINGDYIPDLYVQRFELNGDTTQPSADDLKNISKLNDDLDFLPNVLGGVISAPIPDKPETWATEGVPFTAKLELRGYGEHFNDATADKLPPSGNNIQWAVNLNRINGVDVTRVYTDPDVDPKSTLTKAEFMAFIEQGGDPANPDTYANWSPERPTSPILDDTDDDGFSDGYEYYFWYLSHVGWMQGDKHVYLTGERYDPMNPGEPQLITAKEIATLFDPIVASNADLVEIRDTDNDGIPDMLEYLIGTNPINWDTDGDGFPDGYEVMLAGTGGDDPSNSGASPDPLFHSTVLGLPDAMRNYDGDYMAFTTNVAMKVMITADGYLCYEEKADEGLKMYDTLWNYSSNSIPKEVGFSFALANGKKYMTTTDIRGKYVEYPTGTFRLAVDLAKEECWEYAEYQDEGGTYTVRGVPAALSRGELLNPDALPLETNPEEEVDTLVLRFQSYDEDGVELVEHKPWNLLTRSVKPMERFYTAWKYGKATVGNGNLYGVWAMGGEAVPTNGTVVYATAFPAVVHRYHHLCNATEGFDPRTAWSGPANVSTGFIYEEELYGDATNRMAAVNSRAYNNYDEFLTMAFFANLAKDRDRVIASTGNNKEMVTHYGYSISEVDITPLLGDKIMILQNFWSQYSTHPGNPDTDLDGIPDGWELYTMGGNVGNSMSPEIGTIGEQLGIVARNVYPMTGPISPYSPLVSLDVLTISRDPDGDGLTNREEFSGMNSVKIYESVSSTIVLANPKWTNKLMPTDPWNTDTDEDGVTDGAEGQQFLYGEPTRPGAGGGLNPLSWDTDADGLPDPWEIQFTGEYVPGEVSSETRSEVAADGTTNTVTITSVGPDDWRGGMNGTVNDAKLDYDGDGLLNYQEYLVNAMRCWRYDDTVSDWDNDSFSDDSTDFILAMTDMTAWGEYWYTRIIDEQNEFGKFNPHFFDGAKDNGASWFSRCRNEWDPCYGLFYMFYDGVYHDLSNPPEEYSTLFGQYNRFTWKYLLGGPSPWAQGALSGPVFYGFGTKMFIAPLMYAGTDPRKFDSDNDGLDDGYELFHGMNPLLGASEGRDDHGQPPLDLVYLSYVDRAEESKLNSGSPLPWPSAENNYWFNDEISHATVKPAAQTKPGTGSTYDFEQYPWLNGLAYADPDGDNLRNQIEGIMPNMQAASTWLHTDPTPLWMTDSDYEMSIVRRYYRPLEQAKIIFSFVPGYFEFDVDGDGNIDEDEHWEFNEIDGYSWDEKTGTLTTPGYKANLWGVSPSSFNFSFEENEGYDSDHDYLSDFEERQGKTKPASDAQDMDSPHRRQAMWFDGEKSFLMNPLESSEVGPCPLPIPAELPFLYYTVECWVKSEDPERAGVQTVVERAIWTEQSNPADEKFLRKNFSIGIKDGCWYTKFDSTGTDAKQAEEITDGPKATTNWTHVAATYDGTSLKLFVNGVCVKNKATGIQPEHGLCAATITPVGSLAGWSLSYSLRALFVGASPNSQISFTWDSYWRYRNHVTFNHYDSYFKGYVDEVRIWDGARPESDILADYNSRKRYTREDALANRNEVYAQWSAGATRAPNTPLDLPPELRYHFQFDHIPGAVDVKDVMAAPAGFTTSKNVVDAKAIWSRPANWQQARWALSQIASTVYNDRAWVPWIANTVSHLPRFDLTTLDSVYWSEDYAGAVRAIDYGYKSFVFPRKAEPVSRWTQTLYNSGFTTDARWSLVTGADDPALYRAYCFTLRNSKTEGSDMLPFGNAYAKRISSAEGGMWDEAGAADAWAHTGSDDNANGLPSWWEAYARANYMEDAHPSISLEWSTIVNYNGMSMPAWQAYLRDLALGMLPDAKYHEEYANNADLDGDGLPDWWEDYWSLVNQDGLSDPDNDGLSNLAEYRISEGASEGMGTVNGYPAINPLLLRTMGGQEVPDYFLKMPATGDKNGRFANWYLGEIVADHDMLEDDDEKALGTDTTLYDAWSDKDEDGWTAWSEQRYSTFKMSIVARLISHMNGTEEVIDSPIPVIHTTLRYNGEQGASGTNAAAIVIEAYSGNNLQKKPNALWRIVPGETQERHLYLGAWDRDKVFHGSLVPGHIFPGVNEMVIQYAFVQGKDNFTWEYNGRIFYGTYDEMLAAYTADPLNVFVSAAPFEWVDVHDGMVTNDMRSALQIAIDEKTQKGHFLIMNKKVGEIDAITGDFTLNLAQFEGLYMLDTQVSLEQSIFRLKYRTRVPTTQTKALPVTLGKPDSGSLKEGNTALVAYMDLDGSGTYTPGEPLGFKKDLEIGWDQVPSLTIEMTDASVAAGKRFAYDDTVETLRIIRTAINGRETFEDGTEVKRRIVYSRNATDVERKTVYEGDLVTAGKFGLDWTGLRSDILAAGLQLKDVNEVTYKVVKNTASLERIEEENIIDTITVAFSAQQIKPTAVSPSASSMGIVESQRPTFIWTGTDDNTAFMLKISDLAGNVVYSNDMQLLPPRDANGRYVWQAPVYIGTNSCSDAWALNNAASYTWQVAMFNAKYSSPLDAVWSDPATFSTALAASNDMTTEFGTAKVAVRYYGPATNTLNQVVVALYKNADFTGEAAAQSRLYDVDGAACDKLAVGVFEKADGLYEVTFMGLESGDYYAMAYIDRNGNMKRDKWESWGYANQIGLGYQAIYMPVAAEVDADIAVQPYVTVYIEDTDVNQDDIPDCLTEDESILSAATKTMTAGSDETDTDLDGLTADEETGDSYTEKAKWDSDDDGMPDGWEYRFADLDPLYPDADLVVSGDTMAFAVETGKRFYDASGTSYLLMTTNDVTYRVGDVVTNEHLATYYDYKTVIGSGTNVSLVTYCGVGTNLTGSAATFKVDKIEDVTIAYVHAQVYDRYGYSLKTAIPQDGAINTKPFTALDKYMVVRYLAALGLADEETMNISKMWKDYTLKPRDIDNDRDGIADGWELYVMFGTNGCGFVEGALGAVEKATSLSQVKISPWNFADRELDLDGDGLSNVNENSDGDDPSDPWNQYSVYESLVADGVISPTTGKFDDKVRRFGIGASELDNDWDLDLVSNGQEMRAYYIDYANGSTLLADIQPTNAWSDAVTPDYFRKAVTVAGTTNYLGAIYNGGEFIEPTIRKALGMDGLLHAGTRNYKNSAWDIWSTARYSIKNRDNNLNVDGVVSDELMLLIRYWDVIRPGEFTGTSVGEAVEFFHTVWGGVRRLIDSEGNVLIEVSGPGSVFGPGTIHHADAAHTTTQIVAFFGGQKKMEETILLNKKDFTEKEIVTPEPAVDLVLKYAGNSSYNLVLEAYQVSSAYPEMGDQMTAQWTTPVKFDSGVAIVNEMKTPALGSLKQGAARFIAYFDNNGDGKLSAGETWGMTESIVGHEGVDISIRMSDSNGAMPVIELVSADTNALDRPIQTVAIVRTKINGEYLNNPRGVTLRRYENNVNRTSIYPLDFVSEDYIGVDRFLALESVEGVDPGDKLQSVEEVTYEVIKLRRPFVTEGEDNMIISNTNLNHYTYSVEVVDEETGESSNVYYTVEQTVNETFTLKYSITRDIPLEVRGEASSTEDDARVSFQVPADRAVTKFWLKINGTEVPTPAGRGFAITGLLSGSVLAEEGGVYESSRVILDGKWFEDNKIALTNGEYTIKVALGNDKFPEAPAADAEWSNEAKFNVAKAPDYKGEIIVMVKHPFATLEDGKLTLAVYEKSDLANPVKVYAGTNTEEQITLDGLRENGMYYVAAWYVKDAEDGRLNEKIRMPYDTWGYYSYVNDVVENKILFANAFEPLALKAVADAKSKNVIFLQDTDWNDNGIIDRDEDIKGTIGVTPSEAPVWDERDIDGDGIPDDEDDDPVFDNSNDAVESDVMAYQLKDMLCVLIGTNDNENVSTWYIVTKPELESAARQYENNEYYIPRGTMATNLTSLASSYLYGRKKNSPLGLGVVVTNLIEGMVYKCETKKVALVHAQVYDEYGFNPLTANAMVRAEDAVNTKPFTNIDKYLVTNYLAAVNGNSAGFVATEWALKPKTLDFDFDGVPDGWELYTMFGPAGANSDNIAHSPWNYNDRGVDVDGDELNFLNEYDNGNSPTDPWRGESLGNGITDKDAYDYQLKGEGGLRRDSDNDQLSNFVEYMISSLDGFQTLDAGRMMTNGKAFGGDQLVPDYFLPHGSLYLGELFADHDFIEDWLEDSRDLFVDDNVASRFVYDAQKDGDDNGWDNWSEARAFIAAGTKFVDMVITNGTEVVTNSIEVTAYEGKPQPTGRIKVVYNGKRAWVGNIVVQAYRYRDGKIPEMTYLPDVTWTMPVAERSAYYELTASTNGFVAGGKNMFVVFNDEDADGRWTAGEPYGIVPEVDVGYAGIADSEVEITDINSSMLRVDIANAIAIEDFDMINLFTDRGNNPKVGFYNEAISNAIPVKAASNTIRVRVVRIAVNKTRSYKSTTGTRYALDTVVDTYVDISKNSVISEHMLMATDSWDIDANNDLGLVCSSLNYYLKDLFQVTYGILIGEEQYVNSTPVEKLNCFNIVFNIPFELGAAQTLAVPVEMTIGNAKNCPTFTWTHNNNIKDYPAFQLRVYRKDNNALVFDTGAARAPVKNSRGVYSYTAPLYVGMKTPTGQIFESGVEYYYTVSMLDAKFKTPNAKETKCYFTMNVNSLAGGLSDYGMIPVAVKYMGPGKTNKTIRVEAFTKPDFAGRPVGVGYVGYTDSLSAINTVALNSIVSGLPLGKEYYLAAYIDTNDNGVRDEWESWGYGNYVGTDRKDVYTPRAYALADKAVNEGTVPDCVIYIEDADTNDNKIPDVWEWDKDGKLGGPSTVNSTVASPYIVTIDNNGTLSSVNIFHKLEPGAIGLPYYSALTEMQNGNTLSSLSLALAIAGINLNDVEVKPTVTITSFSLTDGIKLTVDPKATVDGKTFKPQVVKVSVTLTLKLQKTDKLDGTWEDVTAISKTFVLSSGNTEIPAADLAAMNDAIKAGISTGGTSCFYRVLVDVPNAQVQP